MLLTIIAIAVGIGIGYARGGHHRYVADFTLQWWPLLAAGLVLQGVAEVFSVPGALSLSVIGLFTMLVVLAKNSLALGGGVPGTGVIAAGVASNLLVTVANGHVPVRFAALVDAGLIELGQTARFDDLRQIETAGTRLAFLGDVIPLPILDVVVSYGDLISHAGLIVLIQAAMQTKVHKRGLTVDELLALTVDEPIDLTETLDLTETDPVRPLDAPERLDPTERIESPGRLASPGRHDSAEQPRVARPAGMQTFATAGPLPADDADADQIHDGIGRIRPLSN